MISRSGFTLFITIAILVFWGNDSVSLWDQDESAYAGFARNMLQTGDWLIPEFTWSDIHRKPPLHFWHIAAFQSLFGEHHWVVRLSSALYILFTVALAVLISQSVLGREIRYPIRSAAVLATSFLVLAIGKVAVTDATLLFYSSLCGWSLIQTARMREKKWVWMFWASFALALLVKGPPIVLFTGIFVLQIAVFERSLKTVVRLQPWFFLPLALCPLLVWGWMAYQRDGGEFISWLIDWYVLKRVGGGVLGQTAPPGTHLLFILVSFIPYLAFIPAVVRMGVDAIKRKTDERWMVYWFIAGWLIWEFSPSKLPAYTVVAHVPLAILIAAASETKKPTRWLIPVQTILLVSISVALIAGVIVLDFNALQSWLLSAASVLGIVCIALGIRGLYTKNWKLYNRWLMGWFLIQAVFVLPVVDEVKDVTRDVAEIAYMNSHPESQVVIGNHFGHPPSLPYYLGSKFNNLFITQDLAAIDSISNGFHVTLILDERLSKSCNWLQGSNFITVEGMLTDRKDKARYYIAVKRHGRWLETNEIISDESVSM
ncbi:MAG: hypothetical protein Kow0075_05890 [Salibacteraceae bacterium]